VVSGSYIGFLEETTLALAEGDLHEERERQTAMGGARERMVEVVFRRAGELFGACGCCVVEMVGSSG